MTRNELEKVHGLIPRLCKDLQRGRMGRRDFLRTATLLGLPAAAAYALAGRITGHAMLPRAAAQETPRRGGVLRISMNVMEITDPATFDWSEKGNLARHVIEPLALVGADNLTRPFLAERWEASDDLRSWTFHLRQGVVWSNGDAFGADDVIANFERWLDPAVGSSNYGRFALLRGPNDGDGMVDNAVEKIDDHTVRFNLREPMLALPESMGDYPALIAHRGFTAGGGNFVENPIGTGPFRMERLMVGEEAVYTRRDEPYWGGDVYLDGIQYIDHGDDPAARLAALASGQVELLYRLFNEQVPAVRNMAHLVLHEVNTAQTGVARMKVDEPPFDNKQLRQAVLRCIDHDQLLQRAHQGLGIPGEDHHVSPVHPEYAELPKVGQDYDAARDLLTEAGYPDGLELTIDCVANPPWEPNTCQVIAEMLAPAGIRLNVNIMPGATYWDRWTTAPFGFTSWTHRPLGTQVLDLAYRCGVPWNESSYCNPDFDALLDRANGIYDVDQRREVMAQLEATLQDDAVFIQPYWRAIFTASSQRLRDYHHQPAEEQHLNHVWLDDA